MIPLVPAPQKFKHPGLSKLGKTPLCGWPRKLRSRKFWPRWDVK
jgi:hypothetical protein